jgi:Tat protein translocase TatB subunit
MFNIGPMELMLILLVALIVVGPKRLPEVGRTIGKSLREIRKVQDEVKSTIRLDLDADEPGERSVARPATKPAARPAPASEADSETGQDPMTGPGSENVTDPASETATEPPQAAEAPADGEHSG